VPSAALPGGTSAVPGNRFYLNLLRPYLTNDYYPALLPQQVHRRSSASQLLVTP
jgi:hypothetical protein